MSDDLINRKALMEGRVENDPVRIAAMCAPTAFDKEKVIEELVELRQKEYCDNDETSIDGEEIYDRGRSQGRFEAYHNAMKIVKKGGIE